MKKNSTFPFFSVNGREISCSHPLIMGILNVTPDSFSDGGKYTDVAAALEQARLMVEEGAHIIDIGGESTRPGAEIITVEEEIRRTVPAIEAIKKELDVLVSIDTCKAAVAKAAIEAGADIVNDISGLQRDEEMIQVLADSNVAYVMMHMRGTPETMQQFTDYDDLIGDIKTFFAEQLQKLEAAGVSRDRIILDPGIGFSKTPEQNLELMAKMADFADLGCPVLSGPSRKSVIGFVLDEKNPSDRIWGTAGACAAGVFCGAHIFRVHDVKVVSDAVKVAAAMKTKL